MEAKANELRIANYLNHKELGYVQVYGMNLEVIQFDYRKEPYYDEIPFKKLSYVPLTEEILFKCGFERNEILNKNGFIQVKLNGSFYIGGDDACTCGHMYCGENLKYLHQLQNLYFALTNEELTVNL